MKENKFEQKTIAGKYSVGPCIGAGSFGQVYLVNLIQTNQVYALKREDEKTKYPQLIAEARLLKSLTDNKGFAKLCWYGNESKSNLLVMEMLGPSLEDLFLICRKRFSVKTVIMLAIQMIKRLEVLHSKNHLHRDIKPQNFLMGLNQNSNILYMVDFGLSKKFRDSKTRQHISYKEGKNLTGTVRYSSINTHMGIQQSRRDDLESIGYLFKYFLFGSLPWQGIQANSKTEKYRKILDMKMSIPVEILFKDMPIEFSTYMNYCRSLKFEDRPDYTFLKKLFRDLMERLGYEMDYAYDWCSLQEFTQLSKQSLGLNIFCKNDVLTNERLEKETRLKMAPSINIEVEDIKVAVEKEESRNGSQVVSEGENIGSELLEESDMKLISSRNPWKKVEQI